MKLTFSIWQVNIKKGAPLECYEVTRCHFAVGHPQSMMGSIGNTGFVSERELPMVCADFTMTVTEQGEDASGTGISCMNK